MTIAEFRQQTEGIPDYFEIFMELDDHVYVDLVIKEKQPHSDCEALILTDK